MKRKLAIMALAAAMVVSNAAAPMASMTVCAAENDEIGDILDDMFGGDKPDVNPDAPGSTTGGATNPGDEFGGWQPSEEAPVYDDSDPTQDNGSDDGNTDTGSTDTGNSGEQGGSDEQQPSGDNDGGDDGRGDTGEVGGILDDMFGGNKPPVDPDAPGSSTGGATNPGDEFGGWQPSVPGYEGNQGGSSDNGNSGSTDSGNSGSADSGSSDNSGSTGSTGSTSTGSTASAGTSASTDTFVQVVDPATGNTVTVVEQAGTTVAVPVTDEATLAVLPEAMVVTAPSGLSFVHALDTSRMMYSVWGGGLQVNAFMIVDAAGMPVVMQDVAIVTAPDGKSYVNVTIDPAITGASVFAANEQKVAFAKHYGIDGVMINGVLADTFLAIAE